MGGKIGPFEAVVAEMTPEETAAMMFKFVGAASGAALALVFNPPRTFPGFVRRLMAAMIFGMIFAGYVRGWLGFSPDGEGLVGASCLTAFVSWAAMGTITRVVKAWNLPRVAED
jgi:hypothetical protein